MTKQSRK